MGKKRMKKFDDLIISLCSYDNRAKFLIKFISVFD
jgi:hypothetical protein